VSVLRDGDVPESEIFFDKFLDQSHVAPARMVA